MRKKGEREGERKECESERERREVMDKKKQMKERDFNEGRESI